MSLYRPTLPNWLLGKNMFGQHFWCKTYSEFQVHWLDSISAVCYTQSALPLPSDFPSQYIKVKNCHAFTFLLFFIPNVKFSLGKRKSLQVILYDLKDGNDYSANSGIYRMQL